MSIGYIYVLENEYMPGLYKIGMSTRSGERRAKEIYKQGGTGVPSEFKVAFEIYTEKCDLLEKEVHLKLSHLRINKSREFFKGHIEDIVRTICEVVLEERFLAVIDSEVAINTWDIIDGLDDRTIEELDSFIKGRAPASMLLAIALNSIPDELVVDLIKNYSICEPKE